MKRVIVVICLIGSGVLIVDSLQIPQALFMFLLAGVVPGTQIVLSGQQMLEFFVLLTGFVLARLANRAFAALARPIRHLA